MKEERLETALKLIEMHLGIYLTKEDIIDSIEKAEKRKKRTQKFGNEFAKLEGKLESNKSSRSEAYEKEFIRIYADLENKAKNSKA